MRYNKVFIDAIGYELAPVVVTSTELEERVAPMYERLHIPQGQLEAMTGIAERRMWEPGFRVSQGAAAAARKALTRSAVEPKDVEVLIYGGVCREHFEPATACHVASDLGIHPDADIYDISNACLGVLNGIIDIANRIELGQIRAGMVVSCESSRDIMDTMIDRMNRESSMDLFKTAVATLTGGSGAVAVLLTDGSFAAERRRRLIGGVSCSAPQHHLLCRWGLEGLSHVHAAYQQVMSTDSPAVLQHGIELGIRTFRAFLGKMLWSLDIIDRVISHQVGAGHREAVLQALGIALERDFATYPYLGNMGTVSLPLSAAMAEERGFLAPGHRVSFLGIGSGLNCLMLGLEW